MRGLDPRWYFFGLWHYHEVSRVPALEDSFRTQDDQQYQYVGHVEWVHDNENIFGFAQNCVLGIGSTPSHLVGEEQLLP